MKRSQPLFEVRNSPVHGRGVFALRRIRKGTTVVEYLGDRVSHEEVDERYVDKLEDDNHTFLFTVDTRLVIDARSKSTRLNSSHLRTSRMPSSA